MAPAAPSCANLLGSAVAGMAAELRGFEPRGAGLVATFAIGDDLYRLQLDPLGGYGPSLGRRSGDDRRHRPRPEGS